MDGKIAVASMGPTLRDEVDVTFGRCACMVITEGHRGPHQAVSNPAHDMERHAGVRGARFLREQHVRVLLTGHCGPEAFRLLEETGVQVVAGVTGTVRNALERYHAGKLPIAQRPNADKYFGLLDSFESLLS